MCTIRGLDCKCSAMSCTRSTLCLDFLVKETAHLQLQLDLWYLVLKRRPTQSDVSLVEGFLHLETTRSYKSQFPGFDYVPTTGHHLELNQ